MLAIDGLMSLVLTSHAKVMLSRAGQSTSKGTPGLDPWSSSTRVQHTFANPQKILVKRGGTHFLIFIKRVQRDSVILKNINSQKILVYRGGTQIGTF